MVLDNMVQVLHSKFHILCPQYAYCAFSFFLSIKEFSILFKNIFVFLFKNSIHFNEISLSHLFTDTLQSSSFTGFHQKIINSTYVDMEEEEILAVGYEDGEWHKPYYDCGGGNIWMMTYTVPFFGYDHKLQQYYFK